MEIISFILALIVFTVGISYYAYQSDSSKFLWMCFLFCIACGFLAFYNPNSSDGEELKEDVEYIVQIKGRRPFIGKLLTISDSYYIIRVGYEREVYPKENVTFEKID